MAFQPKQDVYQPAPPGYTPYAQQGYPPPHAQQGYPPPQPAYPYAQPAYPYAAQQQSHSSTNVVVVQNQPQMAHTTMVVHDDSPNHCLHCIITLLCPWWIFVWIIICCIYGC